MEAHFLGLQMQMNVLRSLDDSKRARAACLKRLQACLICFYPERPDIVEQAQQQAYSLGGRLEIPRLDIKYLWIEWLVGYRIARQLQLAYNKRKWAFLRSCDRLLFHIERRYELWKSFLINASS
jgi:hypothetical protein